MAFTPGFESGFHVNMEDSQAAMRDGSILNIANYTMWSFKHGLSYNSGISKGILLEMRKFQALNQVL